MKVLANDICKKKFLALTFESSHVLFCFFTMNSSNIVKLYFQGQTE